MAESLRVTGVRAPERGWPVGSIRFDGQSRSGVQPRQDVQHGEHGEEEATPSSFVHAGVQGRDRRTEQTGDPSVGQVAGVMASVVEARRPAGA